MPITLCRPSVERPENRGRDQKHKSTKRQFTSLNTQTEVRSFNRSCILCKEDHRLLFCDEFKKMRLFDRLKFVKENHLCENCLLSNHVVSDCRKPSVCSVPGCNQKHTKFIHVSENQEGLKRDSADRSDIHFGKVVSANISTGVNVHLPLVEVRVNDKLSTRALLDSGSTNTFCSAELVGKLGLEGKPVSYSLSTLSHSQIDVRSKTVDLVLRSKDGREVLKVFGVYVVDRIPVKAHDVQNYRFPHLQDIDICNGVSEVDLLIGQDNAEALIPLRVRKGSKGQPIAVQTLFGWSVSGPETACHSIRKDVISHFVTTSSLEQNIDRLWRIDSDDGLKDELSMSQNDKRVLQLWDANVSLCEGHYTLPIPWKEGVNVPNNISLAESRLISLQKSLVNRGLYDRYDLEMQKLFEKGYAESVASLEGKGVSKVWYLPHHAVISDKKPDKLRIVFDCAAKYKGESLNMKCYQGPDLTNQLLHILLRFRQHAFVFMSDVEAMYYQVQVPECDRDALRFLWFGPDGKINHYRMKCHVFGGVWCSSVASYALRRVVRDNEVHPLISDIVHNAFYVDDCLKSLQSEEECVFAIDQCKAALLKGGFKLTKFDSNSEEVLRCVPESDRATIAKDLSPEVCSKALGVRWNRNTDEFYFIVNLEVPERITRDSLSWLQVRREAIPSHLWQ